ncbi:protein of unknown function [Aminobacter niigataensis]|nr:protein of unknown function [Aminobacter niigataensis]
MLIQLEAEDVLGRRGIGRASEEDCEASDVTNVVLPGMGAQAAHEHVLLHALAKRRGRCIGQQGIHGEFLSLKGTPWSDRSFYPLKANACRVISERGDSPAKRVSAWGAKPSFSRRGESDCFESGRPCRTAEPLCVTGGSTILA